MKKVLVIENERRLARFIELELTYEGFEVTVVHEEKTGLSSAIKEKWDIILLGLVFPSLPEEGIYRKIRELTSAPVIVFTAQSRRLHPVDGAEIRRELFIPRPFVIEDLLAGMRTLLSGLSTD